MIKSLEIVSPRFATPFVWELSNPYASGYNIKSIDGIGGHETEIKLANLTGNDGSRVVGSRASARYITLALEPTTYSGDIEPLRHQLYTVFTLGGQLELRIRTGDRYLGILVVTESIDADIFSRNQGINLSLVAPYPYFYEIGGNDNTLSLTPFGYTSDGFEFPFMNDSLNTAQLTFGDTYSSSQASRATVQYRGDVPTGLVFRMFSLKNLNKLPTIQTPDKSINIVGGDGGFGLYSYMWVSTAPENPYARIGSANGPSMDNNWGLLDASTAMSTVGYGDTTLYLSAPNDWKVDVYYQTLRLGV